MKSFLLSLRKLDSSAHPLPNQTASNQQVYLCTSLSQASRASDKSVRTGIPGISPSLCTSLLTIVTSIGIGITFNPQRSWAGACVGTYSSRSGVTIDASGAVVTSATNSVIGYFNSITNAYVPLVNYTGGNNINALATQPLTGNLYFVNRTNGKVVVYNPNDNVQTTLPGSIPLSLSAGTSIIGATFNASGKLYVYYSDKKLIEVDPSTGSQIGSTITISGIPGGGPPPPATIANGATLNNGTTNGDIAIGTDGVIYILGDTSVTNTNGVFTYTSRLYRLTVNGTTANAVAVVNSDISGLNGSAANGLAIDPATGKFYISSNSGTYELNTTTNTATQLTSATGTNDLAACGTPVPDLPTITKAFSPNNVVGTPANSTLTFTLGNTNQIPIYLLSTLIDNLQTGLVVRSPNGLGGTCLSDTANSNKITAVANSNSISLLDGLKIPKNGCTVTVNVTASSPNTFTNTITAQALKTTAGNNPNTTTSTLVVSGIDYGDAPITGTAPNGTGTNAYGEARHGVISGIKLGAAIDSETTSIANATASGDGADDDGISSFPTLTTGATSYSIPSANITATGTGTLHAWIDFNKNGTFDVGEYTSVAVTNSIFSGALNWTGITTGAAGNTFVRFRFTSDTTVTASTPSGLAADGEVEDYQIAIASALGSTAACGTIYGSYNNTSDNLFNRLRTYTPSTTLSNELTTLETAPTNAFVATVAVDPLLDSNNRRRIYYAEFQTGSPRLFYYDGVSKVNTGITIPIPSATVNVTKSTTGAITTPNNGIARMGFAPDGTLYISDAQKTLYRFTPNRSGTGGTRSSAITIVDSPNNDSSNSFRAQIGKSFGGDIAFDSAGRMYIVAYDPDTNGFTSTEFRLFQIINSATATPTAVLLGKFATTDTIAGLAFQANDNKLYMQGTGGRSFSWDLGTNTVSLLGTTNPGSTDLGSCTYPNLNPDGNGGFTKTVTNITNPTASILTANDVLEYTLSITNNGNLAAGNVTLQDTIPTGTTYVPNTTKLNGTTLSDDPSNVMPYVNPKQVNSPGQASGVLLSGSANKATVVFRVKVDASNTRVCNQGTVNYDGSPASIVSDNPSTTTASDSTCSGNLIDYGDAPDTVTGTGTNNYQTTSSDGDSSHNIVSGIALGTNIDADSGTLQNLNADADDTNGTPDDEDGVKRGGTSLQNQTLTIGNNTTLNITTQGSGKLSAWIDLNRDGDFLDAGEQIATDLTPTSNTISLPLTIPSDTTPGTTYARFRYSTQTGLSSIGRATDGEIEDYQIALARSVPKLLLVKRITAINPGQSNQLVFSGFVNDPIDPDDDHPNWPNNDALYLRGRINVSNVKPGDEVEYTIYFLSYGDVGARNVNICDAIPDNMTFVGNSYGSNFGMGLALDDTTLPTTTNINLSNALGDDQGDFIPSNIEPAISSNLCKRHDPNNFNNLIPLNSSNNVSGAVIIKLNTPLPPATTPGIPPNSYGFIRFRGKVK